jgi:hypothetical protein
MVQVKFIFTVRQQEAKVNFIYTKSPGTDFRGLGIFASFDVPNLDMI